MSEERSSGGAITALLMGAALGAAAGLLLAPRAGRDTRRRLVRWMNQWEEDLQEDGRRWVDRSKDFVEEKTDDLKRRVERTVRDLSDR